jgi:hypothetical protein
MNYTYSLFPHHCVSILSQKFLLNCSFVVDLFRVMVYTIINDSVVPNNLLIGCFKIRHPHLHQIICLRLVKMKFGGQKCAY